MRLVNWNVDWAKLSQGNKNGSGRGGLILDRISRSQPDVICLTEAYPDFLASKKGHIICAERDYGTRPLKGRKVLLWSANCWRSVDTLGSDLLPPGRFVSGITKTEADIGDLLVIGVCIPYGRSRTTKGAIIKRKSWQDHEEFINILEDILVDKLNTHSRVLLVGDFNQPLALGSRANHARLREKLAQILKPMEVVSSGLTYYNNKDKKNKHNIDHLALSKMLDCSSIQSIDNTGAGHGAHGGFVAELA